MNVKKTSSDAVEWAYRELIGNDPERIACLQEERIRVGIGQKVYDLRTQAGLTKEDLAGLVGTSAEVIDDLEQADYQGDALSMLSKVAACLHKGLDLGAMAGDSSDNPEHYHV